MTASLLELAGALRANAPGWIGPPTRHLNLNKAARFPRYLRPQRTRQPDSRRLGDVESLSSTDRSYRKRSAEMAATREQCLRPVTVTVMIPTVQQTPKNQHSFANHADNGTIRVPERRTSNAVAPSDESNLNQSSMRMRRSISVVLKPTAIGCRTPGRTTES